ncbi:MAG: toll/interleukin-1 receptor domain-containing protein [Solirubrobacteraceae bacterium]
MKVFLSWSGQKSKAVAEALHDWLPNVIQEVKPFMSESDIAAGARWLSEIDQQLEDTSFAIVCVTRENQTAAWLNFEAGAVAKVIDTSRVVPLAVDLTLADVKPPLGHFQAKDISEAGIRAVLESLNDQAEQQVSNLAGAFDKWWPDLEPKLKQAATTAEKEPVRPDRELLEEILAGVRNLGEWSPVAGRWRDVIAASDARAAELAHEAERLYRGLELLESEVRARRARDGAIADRALREVIKALPGARAVATDDYLRPRIEVWAVTPLTTEQSQEAQKRAARFGFDIVFVSADPTRPAEG